MRNCVRLLFAAFFFTAWCGEATAQAASHVGSAQQLKKLDLEDLLSLKVTSVSRRAETASHAAAAVEVITQEQIERTGAASVPDALRLATGVQVSRFGGHSFAISSRGFASLAANKLQVMQDGRSLYSPLFSGVFWDGYGVMLEDLDRIEVIRGPGATMWGANAVNGVINIITKDARDTQGGLLIAGGGTEERAMGAVRYGGKVGSDTYYRVYGRFQDRDAMAFPSGADSGASPFEFQGGFRADSHPNQENHVTLQGDYFENRIETPFGEDSFNRSANLLGRWSRETSQGSEVQLQAYYDHFERRVPRQMGERRNTFDLDSQYRVRVGSRHDVVAGINYRVSADDTAGGGTTQFVPRSRTIQMASVFVQDEITLVPNKLILVLGSKFQWESLDGFEPQPSVRAVWNVSEIQTFWAAASRAVRMPSRIDEDLRFLPMPATGVVAFRGNQDFQPEKLHAFEIGYRVRPNRKLYVDTALFHHDYHELRSLEPTPSTIIPFVQYNRLNAETTGVEVSVKADLTDWWRLSGSYSYLRKKLQPQADSRDPNRGALEGNDASRLFSLWSSMDLPGGVAFDTILRHVGSLPDPSVPSYVELDVRLAWRPTETVELSIVGQNLLDRQHLEYGTPSPATSEVQRGFYAKLTWHF